ncbi:MAG: rRNA maturation RNase YbeY [Candidatus Kerfeldbacteria bacterium]|nr:rRNA maturation RNase YbeY [Candidatus Kerfeldbacteria bacterium]
MPIQLHRKVTAKALTDQLVQRVFTVTRRFTTAPNNWQVAVVAVGTSRMQQLNRTYRGVNAVTDVLSFGNTSTAGQPDGDIVLCYPQAVQQARLKQLPLRTELAWLVAHGLLHLLGYDHEQAADAATMRPLEQQIVSHV